MKLKIPYWNVKGINDEEKQKIIKSLIKMQKADLAYLQETKVQEMTLNLVKSLGVGRFLEWDAVEARGVTSGVDFMANRILKLIGKEKGIYLISCRFRNCEVGCSLGFTGQLKGETEKNFGQS